MGRVEAMNQIRRIPNRFSYPRIGKCNSILHMLIRLVDVTVSAVALAVGLPFLLLLSALVSLDCGSSPIRWQRRVNADGRSFRRYRFSHLRPAHDDRGHRLTDKQRTSWFGSVMLATGCIKLPQLINVLAGHLSLTAWRSAD
jgi:lipopolysaccharide/colanic/teichoic acid biosynthesis glycosyltransferase